MNCLMTDVAAGGNEWCYGGHFDEGFVPQVT